MTEMKYRAEPLRPGRCMIHGRSGAVAEAEA